MLVRAVLASCTWWLYLITLLGHPGPSHLSMQSGWPLVKVPCHWLLNTTYGHCSCFLISMRRWPPTRLCAKLTPWADKWVGLSLEIAACVTAHVRRPVPRFSRHSLSLFLSFSCLIWQDVRHMLQTAASHVTSIRSNSRIYGLMPLASLPIASVGIRPLALQSVDSSQGDTLHDNPWESMFQ